MSLPRVLRTAFFAVCAADLVALLAGADLAHTVLKPLLIPVLLAYVVMRGGPRLLWGALLCGWAGDVLLLFDQDAAFLAGMGCFAAGHVCYLVLFRRYGQPRARGSLLGIVYFVVLTNTVAALWTDLPAGMRVPVAAYSVLLTAMAFGASRLGRTAGVGGALFLLSDSLIALGVADWPALPQADFWIMLTYVAAQFLLAQGVLEERPAPGAAYREESAATRRTPH
ncbi:lysoplasmalogenase [Streptomyces sp. VRA16 Mangrove soil]|uniref:lysoplasmalogenase n=1 Tax=Streptomyces sp. VRA16 Mangrove soil TaxID=2817434 RepID=UPI001A9F658D|nr:lysoplasmalogenase [Streptomyces sp. VRA16 Mangrove soil]MBO1335185.1 lysoplasmalogenase [Streptomyces sp. VRA16 Mangrove soil]